MSTATPETWEQIRAAEDAQIDRDSHAALSWKARQIMPHVSAETARRMRVAMLGGTDYLGELYELVVLHWRVR